MTVLAASSCTVVVMLTWVSLAVADPNVAWSPAYTADRAPRFKGKAAGRKLLATNEATKTIFNNGWAPNCGWWASGASDISVVPGAGVGQANGLCTTFPKAEGWMSFRCGGSDDLPSALRRSSAVEYFVSQLPGGSIGGSTANATVPAGLQLTLQDADGEFLCNQPLGFGSSYSSANGIKTNNRLVQTSNKFQASSDAMTGSNQDCNAALQSATAIGFRSLWGGVSFCVDAMQLV